jgi:hypothetical protein
VKLKQDKDRRYDKEGPGYDAAGCAMRQPSDMRGKLLRLRAGQQLAKVERV